MKDVVEIDIAAPLQKVAELFAAPARAPEWMDDMQYEPLSGEPGVPGSKYRLAQRDGKMNFVATVLARDLPRSFETLLDAPDFSVHVTGTFAALSPQSTRLTSREVFRFKSLFQRLFALFARPAIRKAHRKQMESFKQFAERI